MKVLAMLGGALVVGALVWFSVAAQAADLGAAAWWLPAVMLAWPAALGVMYVRERR